MNTIRLIRSCVVLPLLLLVTGCDGVYRTVQTIEITVADAKFGRGIEGASVESAAKYIEDWNLDLPEAERANMWMDRFREGRQTTGEDGHATMDLEIYTVSGGVFPGIFPGFDPKADRVTGVMYLFRIQKGAAREVVAVDMKPGSATSGDHFTIAVVSIGKPNPQD